MVWKTKSSLPSWPGCIQSRKALERETQTTGTSGRRWSAMWSRNYRLRWVADPDRRFQVSVGIMSMEVLIQSLFWFEAICSLFKFCIVFVHPFQNEFSSHFQRASFNIILQNLFLIQTVIYMLCSIHPFLFVQCYRSDLDPAVFPPEPPKWCLDLPSKSPRLPNGHKGTKAQPSPRLPRPLPRRWWKTSCPSKSKTTVAYFSSFL